MSGAIAMGTNKITGLGDPTLAQDAATKTYVDTADALKLNLSGGTMSGEIAMGTSKITGLGNPSANQDAATKVYVDNADALKLNLTGGTMTGNIVMGANKVTSTATPTTDDDLTRKAYVDSILGSATAAADSAAAAAESETNAAQSETNAAQSATDAANSFDSFDDRYLGAKASAPSVDNDGDALLTGAIYWNTSTNNLFVWTGSAWNPAAFDVGTALFDADIGVTVMPWVVPGTSGNVFTSNGTAWVSQPLDALDTQTATTSSTTQTSIATYATASFDAAKVVVVADNGTDRTVSELLVTWKSTTAYATEYAIVNTGATTLASYEVDVSGGNFRILATAASATATNYTLKAIVL
jgi:hypothetical protein